MHHAPEPDPARGVFSTMLVIDGRPVELDPHLAQLRESVQVLYGAELPPHADHGAAIEARLAELLPHLRLRWSDRDVPWPLRVHDRLRCEFRLHAMLWQREG